jgi:hypothetical protein
VARMEEAAPMRPWLTAIQRRDPEFTDSYTSVRERTLRDGAIPAKYKFLIGMVTDANERRYRSPRNGCERVPQLTQPRPRVPAESPLHRVPYTDGGGSCRHSRG